MAPPELLPLVANALGLDPSAVTFLRASQNVVFEFSDEDGISRILRLTAESHRTCAEIEDELEWVSGLHASGLSVCPPVIHGGDLIFQLPTEGETYHGVIFQKAGGRPVAKSDLKNEFYFQHGRHLGVLHNVSRQSAGKWLFRRKPWDEERYFTKDIQSFLPPDTHEPVSLRVQELRRQLGEMEKTPDTHGPVHFDLGYSNFFINGSRLEIFDFDNCANSYYVADIAAALYGSIFNMLRSEFPGDRSGFESPKTGQNLAAVWRPFRAGYESASPWREEWGDQFPLWFDMLYLRSVVHAWRMQFPVTNVRTRELLDADIRNVLDRRMPLEFNFRRGEPAAIPAANRS